MGGDLENKGLLDALCLIPLGDLVLRPHRFESLALGRIFVDLNQEGRASVYTDPYIRSVYGPYTDHLLDLSVLPGEDFPLGLRKMIPRELVPDVQGTALNIRSIYGPYLHGPYTVRI